MRQVIDLGGIDGYGIEEKESNSVGDNVVFGESEVPDCVAHFNLKFKYYRFIIN